MSARRGRKSIDAKAATALKNAGYSWRQIGEQLRHADGTAHTPEGIRLAVTRYRRKLAARSGVPRSKGR